MRNNCGLKKYPRKKISDPQNVQKEKYWTREVSTRKNLGLPIYPREKILDPRHTHEKNIRTHKSTRHTEFSTPVEELICFLFNTCIWWKLVILVLWYVVCLPLALKLVVYYVIKESAKSWARSKNLALQGVEIWGWNLFYLLKLYLTRCVKEYNA